MLTRMLFRVCVFAAIANVLANKLDEQEVNTDEPVRVSPSGAFRGSWMETRRGRRFQAYRGIRYAEPPVGELRFQPPKPILHYESEVDATEDGPACPFVTTKSNYTFDEDCLIINVYTPDSNSTRPLSVILFLHPGGFYSGTGRSDVFGPHYLLDHDVVQVSINYRLSTLGFLSTGDEYAPGNNGFKDQVAALRWVQRNIAAFGGDPNLVTLAGYSAGSTSIEGHMVSPMSKGLFHRAIMMSGAKTVIPLPNDLHRLAVRQAEILNCPTNSSKEIVDCLKTKPWEDFKSIRGFYEFGFDPLSFFFPVVEKDFGQERFLPFQPIDAIREGKFQSVPLMISQTEKEFFWKAFTITKNETLRDKMNNEWERIAPISFLLPRDNAASKVNILRKVYLDNKTIADDEASAEALGRLYADAIVAVSINRMAKLMSLHSIKPVFYYQLTYVGNRSYYENPDTGKPAAAVHHDDLIYLFSLRTRFPDISTTSPDSHMVDKMTAMWYNFARYGDPHPGKDDDQRELQDLSWPAMKPNDRKYLRIADTFSVHQNLYEDRLQVWEELYPIQY